MVSRQQQTRQGDTEPGEFRRICREVAEAAADSHADLSGLVTPPGFTPEDIRALFAERLTCEGELAGSLLPDWPERIVPAPTAVTGLRELSSNNLGLARRLHDLVGEHPDFEVLQEPTPFLYCFRYVPNGLAERQEEPGVCVLLDRLNEGIVEAARRGGPALVMTTRVRDRVAIHLSTCPPGTSGEDVDAMFGAVALWGRLLTKSYSVRYEKQREMEAPRCSNEYCSSPTEVSAI